MTLCKAMLAKDRDSTTDPLSLDVVGQAVFILECFEKGATAQEIIEAVKGETSLAQAHFLFFKQMGWIEQEYLGKWHLTEQGRSNLALLKEKENQSASSTQ